MRTKCNARMETCQWAGGLFWSASLAAAVLLSMAAAAGAPPGADGGMFGSGPSRNMVSSAKGLPTEWDVRQKTNILWVADLGSEAYGGPVLAGGKIFVGTNNDHPRNPAVEGDRGVLMVFDAADGEFLWQAVHAKREGDGVDWPLQGLCSTPLVEGDRVYYLSNNGHLVALDSEGFRDGENDGPFQGESAKSETDADFIWTLDLGAELGVVPHNMSLSSPLSVGNLLFVGTSNGVDVRHNAVPAPQAPSFLAVDRLTGKIVWKDASPGTAILDGQWSNPAYGVVRGRAQVVFAGGNGWIYSFDPPSGKLLWKFDANRPVEGDEEDRPPSNIIATPVIHDGKVYLGIGNDPETGDGPGRLWAIDASGSGDVTDTAAVWSRGGEDFHLTLSTVAIADGLLFVSDLSGFLYCLDPATGNHYWTYDTFASIWGSPLAADGKVYLGDEDGDLVVLEAAKEMKMLSEQNMGNSVLTTPVAADGVLFVTSRQKLFAIGSR